MAASTQSDRYALPAMQYTHGDVLIKLGHQQDDWLVVHSSSLSAASPKLRAVLSSRWADTIGIDTIEHPRTGESVEVKTLALKYVEGAYFLEGREVVEDRGGEAEVFQDSQWCERWPQMQLDPRDGRSVLEMTKRAFRVLVATMHGVDLTGEQIAGLSIVSDSRAEDYGASQWINDILFPQIVPVCAIAEYLDCLATVGPAMMAVLHSAPPYWQAVAYTPIQHLMLAMKLKDREVFYDAYQHAAAHAYHRIGGVTWPLIEAVTDMINTYHQLQIDMQFRKMRVSAENLRYVLRRLETGVDRRQWVQRPQDIWSILGMIIDGSSFDVEGETEEQYASIARSIFGPWLAEHLDVQHPHDSPALRFNLAVHRLEQTIHSMDPTSIFGLITLSRFASQQSPYKRQNAEYGIQLALLDIIADATVLIEKFRNLDLSYASVDRAEYEYDRVVICGLMRHRVFPRPNIFHITGGAHFDGHDAGYFTCLKIAAVVPFDPTEEMTVSKCEPLDEETLLQSQEWMDRMFEPLDGLPQRFVLDGSVDLLKVVGVIVFLLFFGGLLLSV